MKHISATASFVLCLAAAAPAQVVQLADGHILAGEIQQVTGEGFVLTRADNGGQLQLRWEHLAIESAGEVKRLFDISVEDEGEVLVEAQVIKHMTQSGILREDIGRPTGGDGTVINLRMRGNTIAIPRRALRSIGTRRVPVAQIYTREEFYQEKLAEFAPGDDADRHILLADFLVRVGDYEHSEAHLKRAEELGNSKQPGALRAKIAKVALYKSAAGERGLLDQIKALRARKDFSRGGELLAEFETKYATGKLGAEFAAEKQRFAEARERFYVARVAEGWSLLMTTIAKAKVLESGLTLSAARSYGESEMGREIAKRLAERLKLGVDEVTTLWSQRITAGAVTGTQLFAYGVGSWTLGDQKIMANTQQDKEDKAGTADKVANEQQQAAERQQRKIREFLERAKQAQQAAGASASKTETDEDWWRAAPPDERANFLKAYYAENSGDLEVVTAHLTACVTCSGQGYLEVIGNSGKEDKLTCLSCKGTKFKRWFRAR